MSAPVSLLTDYGTSDGFVAACHGVIARIAPDSRVLDITHEVPPGDVRRGALVLAQTLPYLPVGIHVAVVDPGVGTARRGVLVRAGEHLLVGPDNGVLMWAADALGGVESAQELTNRDLMLPSVSATFHGRDVFAPVAAYLAVGSAWGRDPGTRTEDPVTVLGTGAKEPDRAGVGPNIGSGDRSAPGAVADRSAAPSATREPVISPVRASADAAMRAGLGAAPQDVGPPVDPDTLVRLPDPVAYVVDATAHGEVLTIDRFGNVQTSLTPEQVTRLAIGLGDVLAVRAADVAWDAVFGRTFGDVTPNTLVAYTDSAGHLALALHGGDAAALTHVRPGDLVTITRRPRP